MKKLLNTLYVTKQDAYLHKENNTIVVKVEKEKLLQLPVHGISDIFCFGLVSMSPVLMGFCGEQGIGVAFFTEYGKFLARLQGRQSGNVLLRREQYRRADRDPISIARLIVASKVANSRSILQRHLRNYGETQSISNTINRLAFSLKAIKSCEDGQKLYGLEGDAAADYFSVFSELVRPESREEFLFTGRNRRPPRDPINAMLSFLYSLQAQEISSALLGVGLDPYVGFLHKDRPGRVSLALDLLEEFRAFWVDRLVLNLINRQQVRKNDFEIESSGAVKMKEGTRKIILAAYQSRKQEELLHPYLNEKIPLGLFPYVQSMLLARHLRGDLEYYPPFYVK